MRDYTLWDLILDISDNIARDCEENYLTAETVRERLIRLVSAAGKDLTDIAQD